MEYPVRDRRQSSPRHYSPDVLREQKWMPLRSLFREMSPKIFKGLSRLKGVQRRFEILAKLPQDIWVVDDYGHHPVEIAATLEAARKGWPDHRCVVVVQPHRYSRLQNLWTDFSKGFQKMDTLVLLPVYAAGEEPIPGIHSAKMFSEIQKKRKTETTFYAENELEMKAILKSQLAPKTLFLFL